MFGRWRLFSTLLLLLMASGCGDSFRPVITGLDPPNGATNVDISVKPRLELTNGAGVELSPGDGRYVLYNVTAGRRQIGGSIDINGTTLTYLPNGTLAPNSDFELVMKKATVIADEKLLDVDGSESPEEPLTWPFVWRFSTRSRVQVRAAYNDDGRIFVDFTQPMDQVATNASSFALLDESSAEVALKRPVWVSDSRVRLDLVGALAREGLYTLIVRATAQGASGDLLDTDGDGKKGERDDEYSVKFTGSQLVLRSRLGSAAR